MVSAGELEGEFGEMGGYTRKWCRHIAQWVGCKEEYQQSLMKDIPSNFKVGYCWRRHFRKPGYIIADEPTNGLDIETISWLENFGRLWKHRFAVSHDRHFLDAVCTHVVDVDRQKIKIFTGNYTFLVWIIATDGPPDKMTRIRK